MVGDNHSTPPRGLASFDSVFCMHAFFTNCLTERRSVLIGPDTADIENRRQGQDVLVIRDSAGVSGGGGGKARGIIYTADRGGKKKNFSQNDGPGHLERCSAPRLRRSI